MPTQNVAINLSIRHTQQVVDGITAITLAWINQGRSITKNFLKLTDIMSNMMDMDKDVTQSITDNTKKIEKSWVDVFENIGEAMDNMGSNSAKTFGQIGMDVKELIGQGGAAKGAGLAALANALNAVGNAASQTAGRFKALGAIGGVVGGIVGTLLGPGAGTLLGATMGGAIGNLVGGIVGAFADLPNKAFTVVKGVVQTILGGIQNIGQGILGLGTSLKNLIFGPLSLFGLGAASAFRTVTLGLQTSMNNVYEAAAAFQQLTISLETLTRREMARQAGLEATAISTDLVRERTQSLFGWLRRVSLTSPFTMSSIAHSLKFASAMGLTVKMTKELTLATGNFSAAMGLSDDHQERIMYNLAQIYQQGKLTGREFRDLAISFVPVYDILGIMAEKAGMTTEAFKKLALEGGVPVEEFFQTFIDYMNTNYADAMDNMSTTMAGVMNNIKDFIQVVMGMEVIGPVLDRISNKIADFFKKTLTPEFHRTAMDIGEGLARAFDLAAEEVDRLGVELVRLAKIVGLSAPTFQDFATLWVKIYLNIKYAIRFIASVVNVIADAVATIMPAIRSLGGASEESGKWGANIMKNFARGIVVGAARFLARALLYVKAIIVAFFKGSSPPLVAPAMPKWGANIMNSFVNGMIKKTDWKKINLVGKKFRKTLARVIGDEGGGGRIPGKGVAPEDSPEWRWETWEAKGHGVEPDLGDEGEGGNIVSGVTSGLAKIVFFATEAGMQAAAAFMHGFSAVDFDVLDAIQGPLNSAINALTGIGMIGELEGLEMFYDFSQDLIAAIDEFNKTGQISARLLDQISQLGMSLGPELADLVQKQFDLSTAIKAAEEAQKRLNASIKAMDEARVVARRTVDEYNNLLRAGASRAVLKTKLAEVNAAEKAYGAAVRENIAAEKAKKLADERVEELKEIAEIQSRLVDNMIELLNAQANAISAAKGGGGAEDITETWKDMISDFGDTELELPAFDWVAEEKKVEAEIKKWWGDIGTLFETEFTSVFTDINVQQAAENFATNLKTQFDSIFSGTDGESGIWGTIKSWIAQNWLALGLILATGAIFGPGYALLFAGLWLAFKVATAKLESEHPGLLDVLSGIIQGDILGIAKGVGAALGERKFESFSWSDSIDAFVEGIELDIKTFFATARISQFLLALANHDIVGMARALFGLGALVVGGGDNGSPLPTVGKDDLENIFPTDTKITIPVVPQIDMSQATVPGDFSPFTPPAGGYTFTAPVHIDVKPLTVAPEPEEAGEGIATGMQTGVLKPPWDITLKDLLKIIWEAITSRLKMNSPAKEFNSAGEALTEGIQEGVLKPNWAETIQGLLDAIWASIKDIFDMSSPAKAFNSAGTGIIDGIVEGVKSQIASVTGAGGVIATELQKIIDAFEDIFGINNDNEQTNPFINIGKAIMDGIKLGIQRFKDAILQAIEDLGLEVPAWLRKLLEASSPSKVFMRIGEDTMLGMEVGLRKQFSAVRKLMKEQADEMPGLISETVSTRRMQYQPYATKAATGVSGGTSISFGDVHIANGMDWAIFKAQVQRAIVEG